VNTSNLTSGNLVPLTHLLQLTALSTQLRLATNLLRITCGRLVNSFPLYFMKAVYSSEQLQMLYDSGNLVPLTHLLQLTALSTAQISDKSSRDHVNLSLSLQLRSDTNFLTHVILERFEVFTGVTMKNGVFWDVTPRGSCKNRRFGETQRLLHQGDKNR
jgi:hypothetical protein